MICLPQPQPGNVPGRKQQTGRPVNTLQQDQDRVQRFLMPRLCRLKKLIYKAISDVRHRQGKRHTMDQMFVALVCGVLTGCKSMRGIEKLTKYLGLGRRGEGISDTALTALLVRLPETAGMSILVNQVKDMGRRGMLAAVGLRQHWVAIDGKYVSLNHCAGGIGTLMHNVNQTVYWRVGFLRACLVSAAGRPALGQLAMGDKTGEITNLPEFINWLSAQYGDLVRNITLDAGLWSKALFSELEQSGFRVLAGIKDNKPDLFAEVQRVFRIARAVKNAKPAAETPWVPCRTGKIRRQIWRLGSLQGWNGWDSLRQVILVVQTTRAADCSSEQVELRYFATNASTDLLSPKETLELVRRHWAIENDCNWTFDVEFGEDAGRMCTGNKSVFVLGIVRMIAYNMMQWLRKVHVQAQHKYNKPTPRPWADLVDLIDKALCKIGSDFWPTLHVATTRLQT